MCKWLSSWKSMLGSRIQSCVPDSVRPNSSSRAISWIRLQVELPTNLIWFVTRCLIINAYYLFECGQLCQNRDGLGRTSAVRFPARAREFWSLHKVKTASKTNPASNVTGTGTLSPGLKLPETKDHHSPPSSWMELYFNTMLHICVVLSQLSTGTQKLN
jgi:hypothetical protein